MKHIETGKRMPLSPFRKVAIGSWRHPRDPQTYAEIELNMEPALAFLKRQETEVTLSVTHYIAKALGDGFRHQPDMNAVQLNGRMYQRKEVSAFITTLLKGKSGVDLAGFNISRIDERSIQEVAEIFEKESQRLRRGEDPEFRGLEKMMKWVPTSCLGFLFWFLDTMKYTFNLATPIPGMQPDRFGSIVITNIGALGLQSALVPLFPCSRTPFIVVVGKPFEGVAVVDHEVRVQQRIKVSFCFDHRYIDGFHGAKFIRRFTKVFEGPEKFRDVFTGKNSEKL